MFSPTVLCCISSDISLRWSLLLCKQSSTHTVAEREGLGLPAAAEDNLAVVRGRLGHCLRDRDDVCDLGLAQLDLVVHSLVASTRGEHVQGAEHDQEEREEDSGKGGDLLRLQCLQGVDVLRGEW